MTPETKKKIEQYIKDQTGPDGSFMDGVWLRECLDEIERLQETYNELIFAVGNKYQGETRHQTALRYIRAMEESDPNIESQERKDSC